MKTYTTEEVQDYAYANALSYAEAKKKLLAPKNSHQKDVQDKLIKKSE